MLGMLPGNGHPYSWSAIVNGYDPLKMAACPYPMISQYLGAQPLESVRIPEAQVTHVWTDNPAEAPLVAAAAKIPHVVKRPEDVIGAVDGVLIATDDGTDHVRRAQPFIEAKIPVFIDKPLAITRKELAQFIAWKKAGAQILSSSGMRYAPALNQLRGKTWRWITSVVCKNWERYGIHGLEAVYTILGAGFLHVRCESQPGSDIVYCLHRDGSQASIALIDDAVGSAWTIHAYGTEEECTVRLTDTYPTFRNQLLAVITWMQTGKSPYPFEETIELMAILIAALESRKRGGEMMRVSSILHEVEQENLG